jgi:hypothetical protein
MPPLSRTPTSTSDISRLDPRDSEQLQQGLGIGMSTETDTRQRPPDVLVIVDLTVVDDVRPTCVVRHRLGSAIGELDDRKASVAQGGAMRAGVEVIETLSIRTAMTDRIEVNGSEIDVDASEDAAHSVIIAGRGHWR